MEHEDWFMRQINLLGRVLGKILADLLGLKARGLLNEGIREAEQTLISELDLDIEDLTSIPVDRFVKSLQEDKNFSDYDLDKLADIFYLMAGEIDRQGNQEDKMNKLYSRSLTIYKYLDNAGSTYSVDRHYKIEKIKQAIQANE
jgi:hypothetical protein